MSIGTILLIVLLVLLIGSLPHFPYSKDWGYAPGSALGVVLIIVLLLYLAGRL